LVEAHKLVREKQEASGDWLYDYDGVSPPAEAIIGKNLKATINSAHRVLAKTVVTLAQYIYTNLI
jgi:hypothetical protein